VFKILDEDYKVLTENTELWLDGHVYKPDPKTGDVIVPFTSDPREQSIILSQGTFGTLTHFYHK
jgi:hypothetical protein